MTIYKTRDNAVAVLRKAGIPAEKYASHIKAVKDGFQIINLESPKAPQTTPAPAAKATTTPAVKASQEASKGQRGHGRYVSPDSTVKYTAYVSFKQVDKHGAPICPVTKKPMILAA